MYSTKFNDKSQRENQHVLKTYHSNGLKFVELLNIIKEKKFTICIIAVILSV